MKTWLWLIGGALVLGLLVFRLIYVQVTGVEEERVEFVTKLHYSFSGNIDSVRTLNDHWAIVYFTITEGNPDTTIERKLRSELKYNNFLSLLIFKSEKRNGLPIPMSKPCKKDDRIVVSTDEDLIRVFRKDEKIYEGSPVASLHGRHF